MQARIYLTFTLTLGLLIFTGDGVFAGTFFVSPKGSDQVGLGSENNPWKTVARASQMGGGQTIIMMDGVYNYEGGNIVDPPSGTVDKPTIIKAQNDGGVIIDGGGSRSGISIGGYEGTARYITIEGLKIINTGGSPAVQVGSPDGVAVEDQTHHIIIRRTGAMSQIQSANDAVWGVSRTRDSLMEDVWAWGEGRYTMNIYGCTRVTVRRAVLRWDGWGEGAEKPGDPKFNLGVYDSYDNLFEDILLIDHAPAKYGGDYGGLYLPGNDNGKTAPYTSSSNNRFMGMIILNNVGSCFAVEGGSGDINKDNKFTNVVCWANEGGMSVPRSAMNTELNHITSGKNKDDGSYFSPLRTTITNSLVVNNGGHGINGSVVNDFNNVYGNNDDYKGVPAGPRSISKDPQLKYITRLENGKPGKGAASDGGDMGATVVKRHLDGKLTKEELWPWPFEARIKADMCEDTKTGLCATASLTDYIWKYLGNPNPYSGAPPATVTPQTIIPTKQSSAGSVAPIAVATEAPVETTKAAPSDPLRPSQKVITPYQETGGKIVFGKSAMAVDMVDSTGQIVARLIKHGDSNIIWRGQNDEGALVPPGYYMCRIRDVMGNTVFHVLKVAK